MKKRGTRQRRAGRTRTRTVQIPVEVVGIDSNYEPVTLAAWRYRNENVYPYVLRRGFVVTRFDGKLARRYMVAPAVVQSGVDYLTGVGHGLADLYTGDQGEPLFQVGAYAPPEAQKKIVHFLSCQTAQTLGPDFVVNGARAYFGYDVNFTFQWEGSDLFFECDSEIDRAFAEGLSARLVYQRAYRRYSERIDALRRAGKTYLAATLELDRDHLCDPSVAARWGDASARLT
jgi:hypothetical protein